MPGGEDDRAASPAEELRRIGVETIPPHTRALCEADLLTLFSPCWPAQINLPHHQFEGSAAAARRCPFAHRAAGPFLWVLTESLRQGKAGPDRRHRYARRRRRISG